MYIINMSRNYTDSCAAIRFGRLHPSVRSVLPQQQHQRLSASVAVVRRPQPPERVQSWPPGADPGCRRSPKALALQLRL